MWSWRLLYLRRDLRRLCGVISGAFRSFLSRAFSRKDKESADGHVKHGASTTRVEFSFPKDQQPAVSGYAIYGQQAPSSEERPYGPASLEAPRWPVVLNLDLSELEARMASLSGAAARAGESLRFVTDIRVNDDRPETIGERIAEHRERELEEERERVSLEMSRIAEERRLEVISRQRFATAYSGEEVDKKAEGKEADDKGPAWGEHRSRRIRVKTKT